MGAKLKMNLPVLLVTLVQILVEVRSVSFASRIRHSDCLSERFPILIEEHQDGTISELRLRLAGQNYRTKNSYFVEQEHPFKFICTHSSILPSPADLIFVKSFGINLCLTSPSEPKLRHSSPEKRLSEKRQSLQQEK